MIRLGIFHCLNVDDVINDGWKQWRNNWGVEPMCQIHGGFLPRELGLPTYRRHFKLLAKLWNSRQTLDSIRNESWCFNPFTSCTGKFLLTFLRFRGETFHNTFFMIRRFLLCGLIQWLNWWLWKFSYSVLSTLDMTKGSSSQYWCPKVSEKFKISWITHFLPLRVCLHVRQQMALQAFFNEK